MPFSEDKTQLISGITTALHGLQDTAEGANVRVAQVVIVLDPGPDTEMVRYTWDVQAQKFDIATLEGDDLGSG